jgi:uncharacterized protein YjbI with pentapeptide repeats
MTFDPAHASFTGKLRFQTTNASGQKYYLSYTTKGGQSVPTLSATSVDLTTFWTTYDAANGSIYLVSNAGLFLAVQAGNNLAILVSDYTQAAPVTLVPGSAAGQVTWTWYDPVAKSTLDAYYQLGTGLPTTLSFLQSGGTGVLSALAQTVTTPGLATILSSKSAAGYDLTGVNLSAVSLAGVNCSQTHFDNAVLGGTTLSDATLTGASFTGVDLTTVVWGHDISAAYANFDNTIGVGMTVPSTGGNSGKRATFDSASFSGADWSGCKLAGASLHGSVVAGANFSGATLTGANLYSLQAGKSNDGTVPGVDFSYAYMPDADLQAANLNGANLSHAQIYELNTGAVLLNALLTETDFSRADLSGAQFGGLASLIAGTSFDSAVLFQASFNGVTLGLSSNGMPVSMVGAWLENATFSNAPLCGVRMSGARVAVTVGQVTGVPLFAITSKVSTYVTALNALQLPSDFTGPSGLFATAGVVLAEDASVAVVTSGQTWTLTQSPTLTTPGVEDVGFTLADVSGTLQVYSSSISIVEQGDGGITYATTYTVGATTLPPGSLSTDTRCPNRLTVAVNNARGTSWQQMMTAPRLSLAALDALAAAPRAERRLERVT